MLQSGKGGARSWLQSLQSPWDSQLSKSVERIYQEADMSLEFFIWCWIHLHPGHVLRTTAKLLGLAALVLIPLLFLNVHMLKMGFTPQRPSFEIQVSQSHP
jgi:uncharacterized membrane protein YGL010W